MKGQLVRNAFMLHIILFVIFATVWMEPVHADTSVDQQMTVSSGVTYIDHRISGTSTSKQATKVMKVNLKDSYTNIEVGIPNPLNHLSKVVAGSLQQSIPGHQVVGAVNGSFFGPTGLPVYLISNNNQLVNAGKLPIGKTEYANEPIAFGIKNGKGIIDHYNLDLHFTRNGVSYPITASNKARATDQLILYTPDNPSVFTDTNSKGIEVAVENLDSPLNLSFGSTVTGVVTNIRNVGDEPYTIIPNNGFVLSAAGTSKTALKGIQPGDSISLSVGIDDIWEGSSFMLGSGPMLVNNGKVSLSMDPKSAKAMEKASRTAVAIDKTGQNVFFVTVDGRQPGYSNGMNLTQFAQYLVSLGAYRALNLDGGGSTEMAVRLPGNTLVKLANRPSDGVERSVSTTLMAISTAPKGQPKYVTVHKSNNGILLKGSTTKIILDYVRDQYFNPLQASAKDLKITSNLGTGNGATFTAKKAGKGKITVKYKNITTTVPIEVVDKIASLKVSPTKLSLRKGNTKSITVKGYDSKKRAIVVSPKAVKWSVTGKIGSITKDGVFKVTGKKGTGKITVAYGKKKAAVSVKIVK